MDSIHFKWIFLHYLLPFYKSPFFAAARHRNPPDIAQRNLPRKNRFDTYSRQEVLAFLIKGNNQRKTKQKRRKEKGIYDRLLFFCQVLLVSGLGYYFLFS